MPITKEDAEVISAAVAANRPEPVVNQFPGGMGGMVAAVLFLFMVLGGVVAGVGAIIAGIGTVVLGIFGFFASHFFGEFTELSTTVHGMGSDLRQFQTEVQRANDNYTELKGEVGDRHTRADDLSAQKVDEAAREGIKRELLREVESIRVGITDNKKALSEWQDAEDLIKEDIRSMRGRLTILESRGGD